MAGPEVPFEAKSGTLDLTGSIDGTSTLAIDSSTAATLKIDGTVVTSGAININQSTQTLEVGGGSASLTLGAAVLIGTEGNNVANLIRAPLERGITWCVSK